MNIILTALAMAIAAPAYAQAADPHAGHATGSTSTPAAPAHADHDPAKKGCCADKQMSCCKDMQGKSCCADKAKAGTDAHAGHQGH
jgi:hypothetical protein